MKAHNTESNIHLMYTCTHLYIKHDPKNGDTWKMCKLKVLLVEYCLGKFFMSAKEFLAAILSSIVHIAYQSSGS